MKIRNNSSKAFHNHELPTNKQKSLSELVDKITSKIQSTQDQKYALNAFKQVIQRCYNDRKNQFQLCETLKIPFITGPIALNSLPHTFFQHEYLSTVDVQSNVLSQINYLFEFLKKTKEYYYCWIIYYNEQLKILTVKMMKKYELKQNVELLNSKYCLIGIFVNRQINLAAKNLQKSSFLKVNQSKSHKTSAYSCYDSNKRQQAYIQKAEHKSKKVVQKFTNSQSAYSLQSIASVSKTNSSSFKNEQSEKQISDECSRQDMQNYSTSNNTEKVHKKNFKKKKHNQTVLAETKIYKSFSSKFFSPKAKIVYVKSLQKFFNVSKAEQNKNRQSKTKNQLFRSISSTQKVQKDLKQNLVLDPISNLHKNKKFLQNYLNKDQKIGEKSQNLQKINNGIRSGKISKDKVYSSTGSLNVTLGSKGVQIEKKLDQKVFLRRKLSVNKTNFKKKKIKANNFQSFSKNSSELQ